MEPNLNPSGMEIMVNGIATEKREHRKKKQRRRCLKPGFGEVAKIRTSEQRLFEAEEKPKPSKLDRTQMKVKADCYTASLSRAGVYHCGKCPREDICNYQTKTPSCSPVAGAPEQDRIPQNPSLWVWQCSFSGVESGFAPSSVWDFCTGFFFPNDVFKPHDLASNDLKVSPWTCVGSSNVLAKYFFSPSPETPTPERASEPFETWVFEFWGQANW